MATIYQSSYAGEEIDEAIKKVLNDETESKLQGIEDDLENIFEKTDRFCFDESGNINVAGDLAISGKTLPADYSNFDKRYVRIDYSDYYKKTETYSANQVDNIVNDINNKFNSVAHPGVVVRTFEELEELRMSGEISVGVICHIRGGVFVSGKVSELFSTGNQQEFSPSLPDIPYVWNPKFSVPDACVDKSASGHEIKIYSEDGHLIGALDYPFTGSGDWISLSEFGATTIDDEIRFFVGYPMSDGSYPECVTHSKDVYWDGEQWVEIMQGQDNVCAWGEYVSSADELPKNPDVGTVCVASTDFATNAYKFTGAVNELFDCWEDQTSEHETWIVRALFDVPEDCIDIFDIGNGEEEFVAVCDKNGLDAGIVHVNASLGYPYHILPGSLGVSSITETTTVYLPFAKGNEAWETVDLIREGTMLMYDGEKWNRYSSAKDTGDIRTALDSIIRIQNILIGGVSA